MIDQYNEIRECDYKGEHYSVRDNGAVMRHARAGKPFRKKYDNIWTFGNTNNQNEYLKIVSHEIHRIVAYAFHGAPPSKERNIVDHIDTNRRNNRPENLRWVTRLENILNNEITRKKIIYICGSVEAFLRNPSLLNGHEKEDPNFTWMRIVTKKEARNCLKRMQEWAKKPSKKTKSTGSVGEWIYKEPQTLFTPSEKQQEEELLSYEIPSLTPNATQIYWTIPSFFPCCPQEIKDDPLIDYCANLSKGAVFCTNNIYNSIVYDFVLMNEEKFLLVITRQVDGAKDFALAKITYKGGVFAHENMGSFFSEDGVKKRFTILQGKEWTGPDSIDDYC